jgi:hypothetical protein
MPILDDHGSFAASSLITSTNFEKFIKLLKRIGFKEKNN